VEGHGICADSVTPSVAKSSAGVNQEPIMEEEQMYQTVSSAAVHLKDNVTSLWRRRKESDTLRTLMESVNQFNWVERVTDTLWRRRRGVDGFIGITDWGRHNKNQERRFCFFRSSYKNLLTCGFLLENFLKYVTESNNDFLLKLYSSIIILTILFILFSISCPPIPLLLLANSGVRSTFNQWIIKWKDCLEASIILS
jgi:hypothetical protein